MRKIAVMIDAGFLSKVFNKKTGRHMVPDEVIKLSKNIIQAGSPDDTLFRIYYYDCPPCEGVYTNPIDQSQIDFSKSSFVQTANKFQRELAEKDYIAFRKGELRGFGWKLKDWAIPDIKKGNPVGCLTAKHLVVDLQQKGLDMRIGLDIASISTKKIVDEIAIITGDTDFIPAMKYARKEGCLIKVIDIGGKLTSEMKQHADCVQVIDLKQI